MLPGACPGMNDLVPEGAELSPSMGLNIPNLRPAPKPTRLKHGPPSTKLYHASSIDESQEVESESDMNRESESEGALSRLSSYDTMGIQWLDAEKLRPVDGNRLQAPTALQPWDSDILDLPVGQGRPANQKKLCILSLDGGGMRGLIAARILTRLEHLIQVNS